VTAHKVSDGRKVGVIRNGRNKDDDRGQRDAIIVLIEAERDNPGPTMLCLSILRWEFAHPALILSHRHYASTREGFRCCSAWEDSDDVLDAAFFSGLSWLSSYTIGGFYAVMA
jgi:hypothetical protein